MISEDDKAKIRNGDFNDFKKLNETMKEVLTYIQFIHKRDIIALHEEIEVLKNQLEKAKN